MQQGGKEGGIDGWSGEGKKEFTKALGPVELGEKGVEEGWKKGGRK